MKLKSIKEISLVVKSTSIHCKQNNTNFYKLLS